MDNFVPEEAKTEMRRLFLGMGWGYKRIAKQLQLKHETVRGYLRYHGLDKKKREGTWTQQDVMTPEEAAEKKLELAVRAERNALAAAAVRGANKAEKVVQAVMSREARAKQVLEEMVEQGRSLTERMGKALEHLEGEQQLYGRSDTRAIKDLAGAYSVVVRAVRELAGEAVTTQKQVADKRQPMRIGVIGNVRVMNGGVEQVSLNGTARAPATIEMVEETP